MLRSDSNCADSDHRWEEHADAGVRANSRPGGDAGLSRPNRHAFPVHAKHLASRAVVTWSHIPDDVLYKVVCHLSASDLVQLATVNRNLFGLVFSTATRDQFAPILELRPPGHTQRSNDAPLLVKFALRARNGRNQAALRAPQGLSTASMAFPLAHLPNSTLNALTHVRLGYPLCGVELLLAVLRLLPRLEALAIVDHPQPGRILSALTSRILATCLITASVPPGEQYSHATTAQYGGESESESELESELQESQDGQSVKGRHPDQAEQTHGPSYLPAWGAMVDLVDRMWSGGKVPGIAPAAGTANGEGEAPVRHQPRRQRQGLRQQQQSDIDYDGEVHQQQPLVILSPRFRRLDVLTPTNQIRQFGHAQCSLLHHAIEQALDRTWDKAGAVTSAPFRYPFEFNHAPCPGCSASSGLASAVSDTFAMVRCRRQACGARRTRCDACDPWRVCASCGALLCAECAAAGMCDLAALCAHPNHALHETSALRALADTEGSAPQQSLALCSECIDEMSFCQRTGMLLCPLCGGQGPCEVACEACQRTHCVVCGPLASCLGCSRAICLIAAGIAGRASLARCAPEAHATDPLSEWPCDDEPVQVPADGAPHACIECMRAAFCGDCAAARTRHRLHFPIEQCSECSCYVCEECRNQNIHSPLACLSRRRQVFMVYAPVQGT